MFAQEGSAPRSNPLPFYVPFFMIRYPFVYLLTTNGTPFVYLVQNFAPLSAAVNALS